MKTGEITKIWTKIANNLYPDDLKLRQAIIGAAISLNYGIVDCKVFLRL